MNKIILSCFVLSISGCCLAGKDRKDIMDELKAKVCAESVTNANLDKILECDKIIKPPLDAEQQKKIDDNYAECGKDKDSDLSAMKSVDLTKNEYKKVLLAFCSDGFRKCIRQKWTEMRKASEKGGEKGNKKPPKGKLQEYSTCMNGVFAS